MGKRSFSCLLSIVLLPFALAGFFNQASVGKAGSADLSCPEHTYNVHLFSRDPLAIYISNFITEEEAQHLEEITYVL